MQFRGKLVAFLCLAALTLAVFLQGAGTTRTTNRWAIEGSMSSPRAGACSALLTDGKVLVIGGRESGSELNTVELFGVSGTFSPTAPMSMARAGHVCATLSDGTVLVAGGTSAGGTTNSAELFDPASGAWSLLPAMVSPRSGATATRLHDGRVLIAGGEASDVPLATLEIYDP